MNNSVSIAGSPDEIQTGFLLRYKPRLYGYINLLRFRTFFQYLSIESEGIDPNSQDSRCPVRDSNEYIRVTSLQPYRYIEVMGFKVISLHVSGKTEENHKKSQGSR